MREQLWSMWRAIVPHVMTPSHINQQSTLQLGNKAAAGLLISVTTWKLVSVLAGSWTDIFLPCAGEAMGPERQQALTDCSARSEGGSSLHSRLLSRCPLAVGSWRCYGNSCSVGPDDQRRSHQPLWQKACKASECSRSFLRAAELCLGQTLHDMFAVS